jgi:hypothetical protein
VGAITGGDVAVDLASVTPMVRLCCSIPSGRFRIGSISSPDHRAGALAGSAGFLILPGWRVGSQCHNHEDGKRAHESDSHVPPSLRGPSNTTGIRPANCHFIVVTSLMVRKSVPAKTDSLEEPRSVSVNFTPNSRFPLQEIVA